MAVGKSKEFAEAVLNYIVSGAALPVHSGTDGLYIGLLSSNPGSLTQKPYEGAYLSACEVSAGAFRAAVETASLGPAEKDIANSAVSISNGLAAVDFNIVAPANFNLSGYVLCLNETSLAASAYIGYEVFEESTASKQRTVTAGDTIKINISNLILKER